MMKAIRCAWVTPFALACGASDLPVGAGEYPIEPALPQLAPNLSDAFVVNQFAFTTNRPPQAIQEAYGGRIPWSMRAAPNLGSPGPYVDFGGGNQGVYAQHLRHAGVNAITVEYAPWAGPGPQPEGYIGGVNLYEPGSIPLERASVSAGSMTWSAVGPYGTIEQQKVAMTNMAGAMRPGAPLTIGPFWNLDEAYTVSQGTTLRPFAVHSMEGGRIGVTFVNGFQGRPFTNANITALTGTGVVVGAVANEMGGPGWAAAATGLTGAGGGYYYTGTYSGAVGGFATAGLGFAGSYYGGQGAVYLAQQAGVENPVLLSISGNAGSVTGGAVATGAGTAALYSLGVPVAGIAAGTTTLGVFLTVTGVGLAVGATAAVGFAVGSAAAEYTTVPLAEAATDWWYKEQTRVQATGFSAENRGTCTCQRAQCRPRFLGRFSSCDSMGQRSMPTAGQDGCDYQNGQRFDQPDGSYITYSGCAFTQGTRSSPSQ